MKWEAEGGKGLHWVAIKRFVRKKGFWFVKMGIFYGQREKACAKEVFVRKKAALSEVCKAFYKWKTFGLRKRTAFTAPAKLSDKEKNFFQRTTTPTSHYTKANE